MPERKQLNDVAIYRIGWIAPLAIEQTTAFASLDEEHDEPENFRRPEEDHNAYTWGRIKNHYVVIVSLGADTYGTVNASVIATTMRISLPHIRVGLLVGIGAGLNVLEADIRLGDVVVSHPGGTVGGVIQYDLIKNGNGPPERVGFMARPPAALLQALGKLRSRHDLEDSQVPEILEEMFKRRPKMQKTGYVHPGPEHDCYYNSDDSDAVVVPRTDRGTTDPSIHYGIIASGNRLIKSALERELVLSQLKEKCICLEMEAAGVMNSFPSLVIRGICDYADAHKNNEWQKYAAMTAAAFATELLTCLDARHVENTKPLEAVMADGELLSDSNEAMYLSAKQR